MERICLAVLALCALIRTLILLAREMDRGFDNAGENGDDTVLFSTMRRSKTRRSVKSPVERADEWLQGRR